MSRPPNLAALIPLGAADVQINVSQYDPAPGARGPDESMTPVRWQAIVKHRNASRPWAVAVRDDPDEALRDACALFVEMNSKRKTAPAKRPPPPKPPKPQPVIGDDDDDWRNMI